jgi:hypothetical protein
MTEPGATITRAAESKTRRSGPALALREKDVVLLFNMGVLS